MEDEEEQGFTDSLDLVQKFRVKGVPFAVLYLPFSPQQTLISLSLSKSGQATLFGNLILAFFAQDGQADPKNDQKAYKDWLLRTIEETWNLFHKKFTALWDKHKDRSGEAYLPAIYNNPQLQQLVKQKFMSDLFHDTLGFGAAKMIRTRCGHYWTSRGPVKDTLQAGWMKTTEEATLLDVNLLVCLLKQYSYSGYHCGS